MYAGFDRLHEKYVCFPFLELSWGGAGFPTCTTSPGDSSPGPAAMCLGAGASKCQPIDMSGPIRGSTPVAGKPPQGYAVKTFLSRIRLQLIASALGGGCLDWLVVSLRSLSDFSLA